MTPRRLNMRAPAATITLDGEIELGQAEALRLALEPLRGQPALIYINSPGGVATEGAAMAAAIQAHGSVTCIGRGVVASAATLPFMAARRAVLHSECAFMIHDPAALLVGTAGELRKTADDLDIIADAYAGAYARRTGIKVDQVRQWMVAETWLSAEEAVALRFADEIETAAPVPVARADYTRFRHAPEHLIRMTAENGWATSRPEKGNDDA